MAKKGMKRADVTHKKPRNMSPAVPEITGKAKHGKISAKPVITGTDAPSLKVYHTKPFNKNEKIITDVYPAIDNDLASDNIENDLTAADRQDL